MIHLILQPRIHAMVLAGLLPCFASAETIHVPGDHPTIQQAINAASSGDVIQIAAGVFPEHSISVGTLEVLTIQGTRDKDGSLATTIDADGQGGIIEFANDTSLDCVVKDLRLTGGTGHLNGNRYGGAINCRGYANPTIDGCTITDCTADFGGAIHIDTFSQPTLIECRFENNTAPSGGGVYISNRSRPDFIECHFVNNSADSGGAVMVYRDDCRADFFDCVFDGNIADNGGAIWTWLQDVGLYGCTVANNIATNSAFGGGAIYDLSGSNLFVRDSAITDNTVNGGGAGGAIKGSGGTTLHISDSTICENTPDQVAGVGTIIDEGGGCIGAICGEYPDRDSDGVPDCQELCPDDPLKLEPGQCGCGTPDTDSDADTFADCLDAFPNDPTEWLDSDGDGQGDNADRALRGPCCVSTGCEWLSSADCAALGGTWLGEDEDCDNCPTGLGADLNGDGFVDAADLGLVLAAWGICGTP